MPWIVSDNSRYSENNNKIQHCQYQPKHSYTWEMLVQQVIVLRYIPVIVISDPNIKKNIKKKCKIQNCKIETIFARGSNILHRAVDAKNPEWFNQQIKKEQKTQIGNKFTLHVLVRWYKEIFKPN